MQRAASAIRYTSLAGGCIPLWWVHGFNRLLVLSVRIKTANVRPPHYVSCYLGNTTACAALLCCLGNRLSSSVVLVCGYTECSSLHQSRDTGSGDCNTQRVWVTWCVLGRDRS